MEIEIIVKICRICFAQRLKDPINTYFEVASFHKHPIYELCQKISNYTRAIERYIHNPQYGGSQ